jgi:hypothetical protein
MESLTTGDWRRHQGIIDFVIPSCRDMMESMPKDS